MSPAEWVLLIATVYGMATTAYAAVQRFRAARTWRDRLDAAVDLAYVSVEGMKASKKFGPMEAETEALDQVRDLLGSDLKPADVARSKARLKALAKGSKAPDARDAVAQMKALREQRYSLGRPL